MRNRDVRIDPLIDNLPLPPREYRRARHYTLPVQRIDWAVRTGLMTNGEAIAIYGFAELLLARQLGEVGDHQP
jgi:hypothetical protein